MTKMLAELYDQAPRSAKKHDTEWKYSSRSTMTQWLTENSEQIWLLCCRCSSLLAHVFLYQLKPFIEKLTITTCEHFSSRTYSRARKRGIHG